MTSTTTSTTLAQGLGSGTGKNRPIKKAAVLGAGIMGSRIALHLANVGVDVVLLDMVPRELNDAEKAAGQTLETPAVRNRLVNELFQTAVKSNPSPVYDKKYTSRVKLGNFTDNLTWLSECDWIIEVIVERLDIKKMLYTDVEKVRRPGTLITSNTSGIPMSQLVEGRSDDFSRNFCGTHFFNPPRYLPLLEIIPGPKTDPEVVDFLMHYGDLYLGKKTVLCKDTPAFIANRIGIYGIMEIFALTKKHGLTVEEVDKLTGPLIGNAKSATFRTCDLVGLDTAVKVAKGIYDNCPADERRDLFLLPDYIQKMVDGNMWGDKTNQGFFKKSKDASGKKNILTLDLNTMEYRESIKPESDTLKSVKNIDSVPDRIRKLAEGTDKHAAFLRDSSYGLFSYVSFRIPEIADDLYKVDAGMSAGFGWTYGPFEKWDILGVRKSVEAMKAGGFKVAQWVEDMLAAGKESFYTVEGGVRKYYDVPTKSYKELPGGKNFIILDNIRSTQRVGGNDECSLIDLGDGILNIEFHSKMNTLGEGVLKGIHEGLDLAEKSYRGVVIGNQGENFSVGANLFMVALMAAQKEWDKLNEAIAIFQNTVMRLRYSSIPVVVAPHTMTLGGGCEMTMHADAAQAAAETYIGLVEVGVGVIPGGGGTKEFALRLSDQYVKGDSEINRFQEAFLTIATAKVATSAHEAYGLGILQKGKDLVSVNKERLLADAKRRALALADAGYTQPLQRKDIRVPGRSAMGAALVAVDQMQYAGYASEHDKLIATKIANVLCGGDLSAPAEVTEQYLLDLEREAFLSLCGTQKTLDRIQQMLTTGKPLRN